MTQELPICQYIPDLIDICLGAQHLRPDTAAEIEATQAFLANVTPKKPNWDLRRDVEKRLAKLERRTQRALVQLAQQQQAQSVEAQ